MTLRLIIAFARWVWGVSPAFVTADSGAWYAAMFFGVLIDIFVCAVLSLALMDWIQIMRKK